MRPAAIGSTSAGGSDNVTALDAEDQAGEDEEYIDPQEEIRQMRFNKYMSAFDIDLETLEVFIDAVCRKYLI